MDILLPMHIGAGIVALVASLLAVVSAKGKKLHIRSGRIYFLGMLGIFIIAVILMLLSGVAMWLIAGVYFMDDNSNFIIPVVFGTVALSLGYRDYHTHKNQTAKGPQRIVSHLSNMLGGTIAVITAVLVVNVDIQPSWLFWILPTLVITPLIIWWNAKVLK